MNKLFPNASDAFNVANPPLIKQWKKAVALHRHAFNKTESEFMLRLEAMKRNGEILRYEFEGVTLRWADMRYTPDFLVFPNDTIKNPNGVVCYDPLCQIHSRKIPGRGLLLIEVKGAHIWSRDIVRYKGARAYWPEFAFEMWQYKNKQWTKKF